MSRLTRRDTLTSLGAALLTGCGGGSSSPTPSPAPSSTPTSTPTPSGSPPPSGLAGFGTLGQTASQNFVTLGFSVRGSEGGWGYNVNPATYNFQAGEALRLAAPGDLYFTVPGYGEGKIAFGGSSGTSGGQLVSSGFTALGGVGDISLIGAVPNTFSHTARASWVSASEPGRADPVLLVQFYYGVPTPLSGLPASGVVRYAGLAGNPPLLDIDFSARSVSGSLSLTNSNNSVRTFSIRDAVFSGDRTRFTTRLVPVDNSAEGQLTGQFTGPAGQELMLRYAFPQAAGLDVPVEFFALRR